MKGFVLMTRGGAARFKNETENLETRKQRATPGVEGEGMSSACQGQEKEQLVLRTNGVAARVKREEKSGARMNKRTHKRTPMHTHARIAPGLARTHGWW